ncbi:hypothetical protein [Leifsonia sp. Le1]|uniref:hypothetical protein n=1 Tax=Leifsonia sp. Le1 TaxID=3404918 RepID=UPI003EBF7202
MTETVEQRLDALEANSMVVEEWGPLIRDLGAALEITTRYIEEMLESLPGNRIAEEVPNLQQMANAARLAQAIRL